MADKVFNDVHLNMTLQEQQTRANLLSTKEDMAVQMGKIQKWYNDFRPEVFDGTSRNDLLVKQKTFTGIIGSSNDAAGAVFYFGYARPTTYDTPAFLRFRIDITVPGYVNYHAYSDVTYILTRGTFQYNVINNMVNTSYRPVYYHYVGRLLAAGFDASYGNLIGIGLQSSSKPTTAGYERTVVLTILEEKGCAFTFYDTALKYADVPGTGDTNYSVTSIAFTGNQVLPDSNTYSQTYINDRLIAGSNGVKQYSLCAVNKNRQMESLTTTSGVGNKVYYTAGKFLYKPLIYYYSGSGNVAAGSAIGSDAEYPIITTVDSRYSATGITTSAGWTTYLPIYYEITFDNDRYWSVTENGLTQTLRSGYYYLYIGVARNVYQISLNPTHPVYYYDGENLIDADTKLMEGNISVTQTLTSGTEVADITVGDNTTTLYAPNPTTSSISEGTLTMSLN